MNYWAVIPAAGIGKRMQADRPKQYLEIAGRSILEITLNKFLNHPRIAGVVVAISADDGYWRDIALSHPKLHTTHGGAERCESVLNGLRHLQSLADDQDWALVHDAARPCIRASDIDKLIDTLNAHPVGGLLGLPVADTLKFCDKQAVVQRTVSRDQLWRALTPQMFRVKNLIDAIEHALRNQQLVTDEASAIELMGLHPQMVEGHADNIKVTLPQDLTLAELFIRQQERS